MIDFENLTLEEADAYIEERAGKSSELYNDGGKLVLKCTEQITYEIDEDGNFRMPLQLQVMERYNRRMDLMEEIRDMRRRERARG